MSLKDAEKIPPEQEKDIQQAVGECLLTWAEIEHELCQIFAHFLDDPEEKRGISGQGYYIWDSIISFEAKLNALNALLEPTITDKDLARIWKKLAKRISKKSRSRNEIAHAAIAENYNFGKTLVVLVPYRSVVKLQTQKYLTISQIRERTDSFYELRDALNWLLFALFPDEYRDPLHELHRERPPDLILRIQNSDDQTPEEL